MSAEIFKAVAYFGAFVFFNGCFVRIVCFILEDSLHGFAKAEYRDLIKKCASLSSTITMPSAATALNSTILHIFFALLPYCY